MGKSKELATLTDDGGKLGDASPDTIFFGTSGTLLSSDTHISHNIYWGGSDWATISGSTPSSSMRLGGGSDNEFRFMNAAAGSNSMTTRMTIDASGRVTTPSQPHISGSPFGPAANTGDAVNFATNKSRGTLSFSNNRVTVPVDGVYLIIFQTIRSRQSGRTDSSIRINGAVYCSSLTAYNADDFGSQTNVASVSLSANDYIQFYNQDWYSNHSGSTPDNWQTASVTLIG